MEYLVLGFFTGLSLILAIGAQNIFVIEQGLKKQHIFFFIFFFIIGYLSKYLSKYAQNKKTWQYINLFIICFMSLLTIYIAKEILIFFG